LLSRRRGAALLEAEAEENLVNDFEVEEEGEVGEGAKPAELKEETIGEVWGIGSEREGEWRVKEAVGEVLVEREEEICERRRAGRGEDEEVWEGERRRWIWAKVEGGRMVAVAFRLIGHSGGGWESMYMRFGSKGQRGSDNQASSARNRTEPALPFLLSLSSVLRLGYRDQREDLPPSTIRSTRYF
jgi:hypothetical protein